MLVEIQAFYSEKDDLLMKLKRRTNTDKKQTFQNDPNTFFCR